MPHRNQPATPKVKDIQRPLDNTRPFMDDTGRLHAVDIPWTCTRGLTQDVLTASRHPLTRRGSTKRPFMDDIGRLLRRLTPDASGTASFTLELSGPAVATSPPASADRPLPARCGRPAFPSVRSSLGGLHREAGSCARRRGRVGFDPRALCPRVGRIPVCPVPAAQAAQRADGSVRAPAKRGLSWLRR